MAAAFSYHFSHRSLTLIHVPRFLNERGLRAAPILRDAGIVSSQLGNPETWFDRDVCFRLEDSVAGATGCQFYGPQIATHYELPQLGWWGESVAQSPNLLSGLQFASQTIDTLQKGTRFNLVRQPRCMHFNFNYLGRGSLDPIQHIFGTLVVLRKIGLMTGEPAAISVKIARPYSPMFDGLHEFLGASLIFDADSDGIVFDSDILGMRLDRRPPEPTPFLDTTHDAIALIASMLPYEHPTRERVAKRLNISARTLQRRLADWGVTFEELLDEYRRDRAFRLLMREDHSILEIAYSLGYSDPAHFTRAFKRWTGISPRSYRSAYSHSNGVC
ncbi:helix-turn-helix domain-containing protein [Pseudorhodoplanes sp.]|uniref:helix-turn-helix domain-containing protein n=1 Tax=Pseudorhodoplanes sp. TaxID=1934341 RepID=UPI003D0B2141